ncbi:MAG: diguanylate cyclase [Lachnospiraceae bacterium]|nr:diguanylate cyclase [Lachnospiraceae bacterium]
MKRRIAILANGWNCENLSSFMTGLTEGSKEETTDFFLFLSFASYGYTEMTQKAEALIYNLPDLSSFDLIIIFGPGLNFPEVISRIQKLADESKVPVISVGLRHPGHYYIGTDNYIGMRELADHMIEVHGVKDVLFVAGSKENDDSNERLRAIKDSMDAHGIRFGEENIMYSDWEQMKALNYIREKYKTPEDFPDAFICANDPLAIAVSQLMENHYHLDPKSVKVTGFDFLDQSKTFYPSITTVDQCYDVMGVKTASMIENLLNGKKVPLETIVECKFRRGESCGCGYSRQAMKHRLSYIRRLQWESRLSMSKEGRLFVMEQSITQGQSFKIVKKNVQDILYNSVGSEGYTFCLMFAPILEKVGDKEESLLPRLKLDDEYLVIAAKKDGKPIEADKVDRKEIFPGYTGEGKNSIFLITMLRNEDLICGYMIQGCDAFGIRRNDLNEFQGRIDRAFYTYIRNMQLNALNKKLSDLMEQDALTHVKNRTAYDKYVKSFKTKLKGGEIKEYAIAYFDINNLKVINDRYGHEAGDAYIRNSCKLICDTFKHSPVFRIGGDEFLCIIYNDDFKNRNELLAGMKKEMEERESNPEKFSPAVRVSIATGIAVYDKSIDKDIMSVVNRADVLMYEDKFRMKKGDVR